jgi:hypothetical protein
MCCGQQRQQHRIANSAHPMIPRSAGSSRPYPIVKFEYVGRTGLTVVGRVSGKTYRFERPGFHVEVDARDASSLAAVPNLRQTAQRG